MERGRGELKAPEQLPEEEQRHDPGQQRAAQPLALHAEAAERPHGVIQQPAAAENRQQKIHPGRPHRVTGGEERGELHGIENDIDGGKTGGDQHSAGQRHADAERPAGILQTRRLGCRAAGGQVGQCQRRQPRNVPQPDRTRRGKAGVSVGPEQQVGQMQTGHGQP